VRVLVVVGHPDDETLGCGGYMARLADEGHEVRVLSALRRSDPRGRAHWVDIVDDLRVACAVLGATAVLPEPLLEEHDADTDVRTLHEVVEPHVEWAELVLTHWTSDVHQVHRSVARSVEIATRPFRRRRDVLLFEVATSTDQTFERTFSPQCYVPLERRHVQRKLDAMACYRTEVAPGRDVCDVEHQLRRRGAEVGVEFAEAFVVARQFR
jgi:LmbE family N-acetylglucosaminyl deacetylase